MASDHFHCSIGEDPVSSIENAVATSDLHGADFRFHGVVRKGEDGREISAIRYTCYPEMALSEMKAIGAEMTTRFPEHRGLIYHRIGEVSAGDASLLIRVQTTHSAEGFGILEEYLKLVKMKVPVWKEPLFV